MVLPTSSSPSQSPPSTHLSHPAAEASDSLQPPLQMLQSHVDASDKLLLSPRLVEKALKEKQFKDGSQQDSPGLCPKSLVSSPLSPRTDKGGATERLGDLSEMNPCSLLSAQPWIKEVGSKVMFVEHVSDPVLLVKKALPAMIGIVFFLLLCVSPPASGRRVETSDCLQKTLDT